MSQDYQLIASTAHSPQGKTLCVQSDGREIRLCDSKEVFFAVDNLCMHVRLREGKLKGCRTLCLLHGTASDVRDASALTRPARTALARHPLQVEGEKIYVQFVPA